MRVFHIITHIDLGGAERIAINIAKGGKPHGIDMHVVEVTRGTSRMTQSMIAEMREAGITVHRAPLPVLFHWHYVAEKALAWLFPLWFVWLWLRHRPDVLHSHTEIPDIALYATLRLFPFVRPRKIVRTIHNTVLWTGMKRLGRRIEHFMQQHNANVSISESVSSCYEATYGMRPPIIYNGVEITAAEPATASPLPAGEPRKGCLSICFAARLEEQKGVRTLCEVVKRMAEDTRYHFYIFGDGTLNHLLNDLRQQDNVTVSGPVSGIAAHLRRFDYVFMPSVHEGLATLSIEASLSRTPVLANNAPGLTDTLPPDWPLMVTNNDTEQWLHLFNDVLPTANRDVLAEEAYRFASSRFTLKHMQEEYCKTYLMYNSLCN